VRKENDVLVCKKRYNACLDFIEVGELAVVMSYNKEKKLTDLDFANGNLLGRMEELPNYFTKIGTL